MGKAGKNTSRCRCPNRSNTKSPTCCRYVRTKICTDTWLCRPYLSVRRTLKLELKARWVTDWVACFSFEGEKKVREQHKRWPNWLFFLLRHISALARRLRGHSGSIPASFKRVGQSSRRDGGLEALDRLFEACSRFLGLGGSQRSAVVDGTSETLRRAQENPSKSPTNDSNATLDLERRGRQ